MELRSKLLLSTDDVSLIGVCNVCIRLLLRCCGRWNFIWTLGNGTCGPSTTSRLLKHLTHLTGSCYVGLIVVTIGYHVALVDLPVLL